jgi:hypothetical protein
MILAVHGAVFIKEKPEEKQKSRDHHDSTLRLGVPYQVNAFALKDIGKSKRRGADAESEADADADAEAEAEADAHAESHAESDAESVVKAEVACLVSPPEGLGYTIMNIENPKFPNRVGAFVQFVESTPPSFNFNGSNIATFFSKYENRLYSYSDKITTEERAKLEHRLSARTTNVEHFDFTKESLRISRDEMPHHGFNDRMLTIHNALRYEWKPHYTSCIGSKRYCPGVNANQCCLFFPAVSGVVYEGLRSRLIDFNRGKMKPTSALSAHLQLQFDSYEKCVLTISFEYDSAGRVKNTLWRGISLDRFFRQVKRLLGMVFSNVDDFNLEHVMARTCVVDAACSDFSVTGKKVSIIGFEKAGADAGAEAGVVSALVDVHHRDQEFPGFWDYWIHHKPTAGEGVAPTATDRRNQHRVYIPRDLAEFVPECLTSSGATIRKVEPVFDDEGNVVRVVYTYKDGRTETIDYAASVPVITESMGTVYGSPERPDDMDGDDHGVGPSSLSISRPNTPESRRPESQGGGRRRTSKKKCNNSNNMCKKRKTLRRRKITRKKPVKSRRFRRSRC